MTGRCGVVWCGGAGAVEVEAGRELRAAGGHRAAGDRGCPAGGAGRG